MFVHKVYRMVPRSIRRRVVASIAPTTLLRLVRLAGSGRWREKTHAVGSRLRVIDAGRSVRALVREDATPIGSRQHNMELVAAVLEAGNVPYFCRATDDLRSSVVVPVKFRDQAIGLLRTLCSGGVVIDVTEVLRVASPVTAGLALEPTQTTMTVFDPVTSPSGSWTLGLAYACTVEFWCELPHGSLVAATPDGRGCMVPSAEPEVMATGAQLCQRVPRGDERRFRTRESFLRQSPETFTFPIDAVFTWVDGADPIWLAKKQAFDGGDSTELHQMAANNSRFASRDELRFALRSVVTNAPWVRRIFLVTADQAPPWLDLKHPGVTVVRHSEIFDDVGQLPTFNSHAIEARLHHIPGLAEHFVYFNDDMFLGRPLLPRHFFHANGMAKFFQSAAAIDPTPASLRDLPVTAAAKNNRLIVSSRFGATIRQKMRHAPYPLRRSVLEEIEQELNVQVTATASHRFRHPDDLSIPSSLAHYWAFATNRAVPGSIDMIYADLANPKTPTRLASMLIRRRSDVFCINDTDSDQDADQDELVIGFMRRYFPFRAPFELPDDVTARRSGRSATELMNDAIPTQRRISTEAVRQGSDEVQSAT